MTTQYLKKFMPFAQKMRAEKLPEIVVDSFSYYYNQLAAGQTGFIAEADINPVENLPDAETISPQLAEVGLATLPKTVFIKLNGGLGTNMGLNKAKSLLEVTDGLSFLDIIARHAIKTGVHLLLMNSFVTQADSMALLENYPELWDDIPLYFMQHKIPKIAQADLTPAICDKNPELEWCPPGHGDIYTALVTSGILDTLLQAGYEYAFASNADNLGATIDNSILGYFVENNLPFMMEVADRTKADCKGGHLAQLADGQLILRELAQCTIEDTASFQDITRYKYFNTNNLWLHLPTLKAVLTAKNYILGLPMIRNTKTIDSRNSSSTAVYQLETAMGSAIAIFKGARAIRVPRTRFLPVKKTNDLLILRSDIYNPTDDVNGIAYNPSRTLNQIVVELDQRYYKFVGDMEARFPYGVPSLVDCERLAITGDIKFGRNVQLKGNLCLVNEQDEQQKIEDNAVISE